MQKGQTGRCCRQRSDLGPDTCDTSAGTNAALKTTSRHVLFLFFSPYLSISPKNTELHQFLPHLHRAGRLEGCWRCCSLYRERIPQAGCPACGWNLKIFQTTNTHPALLGLTKLHRASLEAAHVYTTSFLNVLYQRWLRNLDEILPLGKVILSCHSGFLWPPGCWSIVGLLLEAGRMRCACCC